MHLESLILHGGTIGIAAVIFAETGIPLAIFLPGDSLLLTAGILASRDLLNIYTLIPSIVIMAILGNEIGYWLGKHYGTKLFDGRYAYLKKEYLERTHAFFEKHGPKAVILARFIPIIRTLMPSIAGIGAMDKRLFTMCNIAGALLWGVGITMLGYALGEIVHNVELLFAPLIIGIIVVSFLPIFKEWRDYKKSKKGHTSR